MGQGVVLNHPGIIPLIAQVLVEVHPVQAEPVGKKVVMGGILRGDTGELAAVPEVVHQIGEAHVPALEKQREFEEIPVHLLLDTMEVEFREPGGLPLRPFFHVHHLAPQLDIAVQGLVHGDNGDPFVFHVVLHENSRCLEWFHIRTK